MIIKARKIWIMLVLSVIINVACLNQSISKNWYLIGGEIKLEVDLDKKVFLLKETDQLIFRAEIDESSKKELGIQLNLTMKEVSPMHQNQYKNLKNFIAWIYLMDNNQMKLLISSYYNKPYFFSKSHEPSLNKGPIARIMLKSEFDSYKNSFGKNLFTEYRVDIKSNHKEKLEAEDVIKNEKAGWRQWVKEKYQVPNTLYFNHMLDYTKDMDFSTGFITKEIPYNWNLSYTILEKNQGTPLSKPVLIRGFIINTGNLETKSEYAKYRRPRKLSMFFSKDYTGGLGSSLSNFNDVMYSFEIPDREEPLIIIFYDLIEAKAIKVNVDSYYLGEENEASIFDLVFFTDNSNSTS